MAMKIGSKSIMKLREHYGNLARRTEGLRKKTESTVEHMVQSAEVSASAFAFGAVQGKYGPVKVMGVPADLGAGVALHLAGFVGLAGKSSSHLHAFADGALASFFFTLGRGVGMDWKSKGLPGQSVKGDLESGDLESLTGHQREAA
jgi:hypothetical protein